MPRLASRLLVFVLVLLLIGLYYLYLMPAEQKVNQDFFGREIVREEEPEVVPAMASLGREESRVEVEPVRSDFFSEYRWERERSRSRQAGYLTEVLADGDISPVRKAEMEAKLWHLTQLGHKEMELENLIKSKGHREVVVVLTDDAASIVVDGTLDGEGAAQIGELVHRFTNIDLERITIIDGLN
ncbi:MAG: SpoIIIAH-like family protein [Limnochordia bacterium]|jgi:hypothetical protein